MLHELFEEQVERTPGNTAVVCGEERLTYRELNERANRLSGALRERGVGTERIVGMLVERSVELIVGILGILKAGGTYLPVDPEYPEERIRYMLEDSGTELVLTQRKYAERVPTGREAPDMLFRKAVVKCLTRNGAYVRAVCVIWRIYLKKMARILSLKPILPPLPIR